MNLADKDMLDYVREEDEKMNDYPLAYLDELQIEEVCVEMYELLASWRMG